MKKILQQSIVVAGLIAGTPANAEQEISDAINQRNRISENANLGSNSDIPVHVSNVQTPTRRNVRRNIQNNEHIFFRNI